MTGGDEEIRRLLDEDGLFLELVAFGQTYADMSPASVRWRSESCLGN